MDEDDAYDATEALARLVSDVTSMVDGLALGPAGSASDLAVADILDDARRRIDRVVFA